MHDLYEMKLTDAQWWACDIPGNIGWIIWIVCTVLCLRDEVSGYALLSLIPAALMLTGVAELISERIAKLGRILPKIRVLRGFGALTLGGLAGIVTAAGGMLLHVHGKQPLWMLAGALLCTVFACICYLGYRKKA